MRALMSVLGLLLLASPVLAGNESWAGSWIVEDHNTLREVETRGSRARVRLTLPVGRVSLKGRLSQGPTLRLRGKVRRHRGMTGALRGTQSERDRRVELIAVRGRDRKTGATRVVVEVRLDGAFLLEEIWTRPGPPRLEILDITPKTFDTSTRAPIRIRFRVLNRPMKVHLSVLVTRDSKAGHRAFSYYMRELYSVRVFHGAHVGDGQQAEHQGRAELVSPGEHTLLWSGRDVTSARRILLEGKYRVDLIGDTGQARARACSTVRFPRPNYTLVIPGDEDDDERVASLTPIVFSSSKAKHYRITSLNDAEEVTRENLLEAARSSAVWAFYGHGTFRRELYGGQLALGDSGLANEDDLYAAVIPPGSMKDTLAVFLFACSAGAGNRSDKDLLMALTRAGVDVVVGFRAAVRGTWAPMYHRTLCLELMKQGGKVAESVKEAAERTDEEWWWKKYSSWNRAKFIAEGGSGLEHAVRIHTATGIDKNVSLYPARYGDSTR